MFQPLPICVSNSPATKNLRTGFCGAARGATGAKNAATLALVCASCQQSSLWCCAGCFAWQDKRGVVLADGDQPQRREARNSERGKRWVVLDGKRAGTLKIVKTEAGKL